MIDRTAAAYLLGSRILLFPQNRTRDGVYVDAPSPIWLASVSEVQEIGNAIISILAAYRDDVPHPTDWKAHGDKVLASAGLRSWAQLHRGTKLCIIEQAGEHLWFRPTRNGGTSGRSRGFHSMDTEPNVALIGEPKSILGAALLLAFSRAL
jgi:hypothetical protein